MAAPPSLFEKFEHRGTWWLADAPDDAVAGVLTVEAGEGTLQLIGAFKASPGPSKAPFRPELIHGRTELGIDITLYRTLQTSRTFGSGSRSTFLSQFTFVGSHLSSPIKFAHMEFSFTHGEDWVAWMPFRHEMPALSKAKVRAKKRKKKVKAPTSKDLAHLEPPPGMRVHIPSRGATISLNWHVYVHDGTYDQDWKYEIFLRVSRKKAATLDWFLRLRDDLRSLLALLVGTPVHTRRIRTVVKDGGFTLPIAAYHLQKPASEPKASLHPADVLLPLPAVRRSGLTKRVRKWFKVSKDLEPVVDLYFGTVYATTTFVEFKFLALTQALESYHRRIHPGQYVDDATFDGYRKKLTDALDPTMPPDLKDALKARLRFANEFSQRKRFGEILRGLEDETFALLHPTTRADFVKVVVDARNFLTHYPAGATAPLSGHELYQANLRLQLLLVILLLKRLGFDEASLRERIREHPQLSHMSYTAP